MAGDAPLQTDFYAAAARRSGQDDAVLIVAGLGVGAVELVDGDGGEKPLDRLPLPPDLVIVEPLRLELVGRRGQPAELVARLRQVGAAEAAVE